MTQTFPIGSMGLTGPDTLTRDCRNSPDPAPVSTTPPTPADQRRRPWPVPAGPRRHTDEHARTRHQSPQSTYHQRPDHIQTATSRGPIPSCRHQTNTNTGGRPSPSTQTRPTCPATTIQSGPARTRRPPPHDDQPTDHPDTQRQQAAPTPARPTHRPSDHDNRKRLVKHPQCTTKPLTRHQTQGTPQRSNAAALAVQRGGLGGAAWRCGLGGPQVGPFLAARSQVRVLAFRSGPTCAVLHARLWPAGAGSRLAAAGVADPRASASPTWTSEWTCALPVGPKKAEGFSGRRIRHCTSVSWRYEAGMAGLTRWNPRCGFAAALRHSTLVLFEVAARRSGHAAQVRLVHAERSASRWPRSRW